MRTGNSLRKALWAAVIAVLCICLLTSLLTYIYNATARNSSQEGLLEIPERYVSAQEGEPDILGSRAYITESLERGPGWQQIVFDSPFQLGEKELAGSWQAPDGPEDYYDIVLGSYPCIDGSTVAVPMAVEFARQHLGLSDEDANGLAWFNTTHNAYLELITGSGYVSGMIRSENAFLRYDETVDIIIVTAPSGNELWLAQQYGITLIQEPVCYDAFVFITHKDNPVDSLTLDQVRGIYSGEITNWRQVGGNDERIIAFQREENSGSQTGMIDLVMGDIPMLPPEKVKVAIGMGMLVDEVAEYQNNASSIGYTYRYYIDNLYKNENIKILKIDGVSAEEENLRSGAYPLTVSYYGIIRASDEQSTGGLFLDWMLSPEGQACIKQAGYIPYYE